MLKGAGSESAGAAGRVEIGCAGHFIGAASCRWHRHTQVGAVRVATVGQYMPFGELQPIGYSPRPHGSDFETMVFRTTGKPASDTGCGCVEVASWTEIDCDRYATAGDAHAGHEAMVAKYIALAAAEGKA